jgi:hypothetical protein
MKNLISDLIWKLETKSKRFDNGFWTGRLDACSDISLYIEELEAGIKDKKALAELKLVKNYVHKLQFQAWTKLDTRASEPK